jgi:hypothetical protein
MGGGSRRSRCDFGVVELLMALGDMPVAIPDEEAESIGTVGRLSTCDAEVNG